MHEKQVNYSKTETTWTITCLHCRESKPDQELPTDTVTWMGWMSRHPCFDTYYTDHDRAYIKKLEAER